MSILHNIQELDHTWEVEGNVYTGCQNLKSVACIWAQLIVHFLTSTLPEALVDMIIQAQFFPMGCHIKVK